MAITLGNVSTQTHDGTMTNTGPEAGEFTHTVAADTTILILAASMQGNIEIQGTVTWDVSGNQSMTLIHEAAHTSSTTRTHTYFYGLVNPTAGAGELRFFKQNSSFWALTLLDYKGTISSSVANATNFLDDADQSSNTATTLDGSGGSAGNTFVGVLAGYGGDRDPVSNNRAAYTERAEVETGTASTAELVHYVIDAIDGLAQNVTTTWTLADANNGVLIEILPAASGLALPTHRNIDGGMNQLTGGIQ